MQVGYKAAAAGIHTATGATAGAINAAMTGGDIAEGAFIGGLSAGAAELMGGGEAARLFTGAAAGGVASVMAGGDFAQGAIQGAMTSAVAYLCNHTLHKIDTTFKKLKAAYKYKSVGRLLKNVKFKEDYVAALIEKGGSCGARLSYALNGAGSDFLNSTNIQKFADVNGNYYVLDAQELAKGLGVIGSIKSYASIQGKTGIVYFENPAEGLRHIDLWDRSGMVGNSTSDYSSATVYFLEVK